MDLVTSGNAIGIGGMFNSNHITFTVDNSTLNNHQSGYEDLWIAKYLNNGGTSVTKIFATNYPGYAQFYPNDHGMAMEYIPNAPYGTIYYTVKATVSGVIRSYILAINATNGTLLGSAQIGTGSQYYHIRDMVMHNSQIYACGYYTPTFGNTTNQVAALIKYPTPLSSLINPVIVTSPTGSLWESEGPNNEFNKLLIAPDASSNNKLYTTGTFGSSKFRFPPNSNFLSRFGGTTNHLLMRTNLTNLNFEVMTGLNNTTIGMSKGFALAVDINSIPVVFYQGGKFDKSIDLDFNSLPATFTAVYPGNDAFLARFVDNGLMWKNIWADVFQEFSGNNIFPNPSTGMVYISTTENVKEVIVCDLTGKRLLCFENKSACDLSGLTKGIYLITIKTENSVFSEKISLTE